MPPFDAKERLVELAAGVYVEQDVLRVVQTIQEYDPNLRVKYLDPDSGGSVGDPPYKVVELCPDGIERVVFSVWKLDGSIVERLRAADTQKLDILVGLETKNQAVRDAEKRRFREEVLGEAHDIAHHVLRSPRSSYTVEHPHDPGTRLIFDSTHPIKRRTRTGIEAKHVDIEGPDESG